MIVPRSPKTDSYLNGIKIKKNTLISINYFAIHRNRDYYRDPEIFRPERWEECADLPPYCFGGFGGGSRSCIGKHFAMLEAKISLIKFFKRYSKIELPKKDFSLMLRVLYKTEDMNVKLTLNKN